MRDRWTCKGFKGAPTLWPESPVHAFGVVCKGLQKHLPVQGMVPLNSLLTRTPWKDVLATVGVNQQVEANSVPWPFSWNGSEHCIVPCSMHSIPGLSESHFWNWKRLLWHSLPGSTWGCDGTTWRFNMCSKSLDALTEVSSWTAKEKQQKSS